MMEGLGVHRKRLKRSKAKTTPIKVVYIANPVRVTTSAATFRSLVQKLTGRDADTGELDTTSCSSPMEPADDASTASAPASVASPDSGGTVPSEPSTSGVVRPDNSLVAPVEVFDEDFDAQMMGSFPGFISSILCYEPRVAGLEGFTEVNLFLRSSISAASRHPLPAGGRSLGRSKRSCRVGKGEAMGNVSGRDEIEDGGDDDPSFRSRSDADPGSTHVSRTRSVDSAENWPPENPGRSRSPLVFAPQVISRTPCW
ncbi:hypothetical protein BHM03_00005722 [Ensete ventricosum]|nr:hypothetical protein BHM03_00005722 [Ensete ventricosum]